MTVTGDQYIRGSGDIFTLVILNLTFFGNEALNDLLMDSSLSVVKTVWCHL